mmetsp:Transcript_150611/g.484251  ORF Transcript_150611/g.484251 Transcript_150611/m.484251 type:complete len:246 (-) Transcript_150611:43-780(-)|eukprot:CAMPEP_0203899948 /NCGR_PEP_ID=MMETSP0359-20131031/42287_1 /ASSEMBLY_ACC=CAM_ASM_000338 /TAXON_ID=268821 /ORGANISM="Scrippsiella Hangoei, Strain SHTV-5" /LENGTH=245 /DNA_ID=CAMNT_0050823301 /DNA_START=86 /DNA_END=823 /DNA_ORIENTATION=-
MGSGSARVLCGIAGLLTTLGLGLAVLAAAWLKDVADLDYVTDEAHEATFAMTAGSQYWIYVEEGAGWNISEFDRYELQRDPELALVKFFEYSFTDSAENANGTSVAVAPPTFELAERYDFGTARRYGRTWRPFGWSVSAQPVTVELRTKEGPFWVRVATEDRSALIGKMMRSIYAAAVSVFLLLTAVVLCCCAGCCARPCCSRMVQQRKPLKDSASTAFASASAPVVAPAAAAVAKEEQPLPIEV